MMTEKSEQFVANARQPQPEMACVSHPILVRHLEGCMKKERFG
jgi:hypothetical protein